MRSNGKGGGKERKIYVLDSDSEKSEFNLDDDESEEEFVLSTKKGKKPLLDEDYDEWLNE